MPLSPEQLEQKKLAIAADKQIAINKAIAASTGLQQALAAASAVVGGIKARGYVLGAEDAIAETDLIAQQFTLEEFNKVIELFGELQKFAAGQPVKVEPWALANARVAGL